VVLLEGDLEVVWCLGGEGDESDIAVAGVTKLLLCLLRPYAVLEVRDGEGGRDGDEEGDWVVDGEEEF